MKKIIIFYLLVVNATCLSLAGSYHWYKGNTHCHTIMSDGKNTPADEMQRIMHTGTIFWQSPITTFCLKQIR